LWELRRQADALEGELLKGQELANSQGERRNFLEIGSLERGGRLL
jgi:hypothetical protein